MREASVIATTVRLDQDILDRLDLMADLLRLNRTQCIQLTIEYWTDNNQELLASKAKNKAKWTEILAAV